MSAHREDTGGDGSGNKVVGLIRDPREAVDLVEAYASAIAPGASARDREGAPPVAELSLLARTGLLGLNVPRANGGAGGSVSDVIAMLYRIASVDSSIAQIVQSHYASIDRLRLMGPDNIRAHVCRRVLAGDRLSNASAERGGRTSADFRTRVTRVEDGSWRINGTKYYTTGALTSQIIVVRAVAEDGHIATAHVDRNMPGIEILDDWNGLGQRTTQSGTAHFRDVPVAAEYVDFNPYHGEIADTNKAFVLLTHATIEAGIACNALSDGRDFLKNKARPYAEIAAGSDDCSPANNLLYQESLGRLAARVKAVEAFLMRCAAAIDRAYEVEDYSLETVAGLLVSVGEMKAFAADIALEVATSIYSFGGASATSAELNLDRHWRNARTHSLHDSTQWKYVQSGRHQLFGPRASAGTWRAKPTDDGGR